MKTINATDAVRTFSELLNSIKYKGDRYTVLRGGKPVANIVPFESVPVRRTLGELRSLIKNLPSLGDDADRFANDIEKIIREQPSMPEKASWE
ncbi:MAG: type II toxin-antitoxin system Phd/YefM family antitoxin [Nitrospirae bacterium]|nr:type II toxin-antitoxin system Phd/YefM family antitoxin [Nitrospirota bacterium]